VRAGFLPITADTIDRVLPFMSRLYEQDALNYDTARARRVAEWLLANPDHGAIWLIQSEGADCGYLAVTVCVSIEFHGRFAMLDELYIDESARRRGLGPEAVAFAIDWARQRGFAAIRLEVAEENVHAQHVYAKQGFSVHHDRRLMTKWL
jgi:ribosomal protein S18 acetylase RimI-like enzyme